MKIAKSLLSVLVVSLWLAFATEVCARGSDAGDLEIECCEVQV